MLGNIFKKAAIYFSYAVFLLFIVPSVVHAQERILDYDVEIEINEDSSFVVRETIQYDFGDISRHGIFRDIPIKYPSKLGNRTIKVTVISITRDGFLEDYSKSRVGNDLSLKIGKKDFTISGEHVYRITYKVEGAFNEFATMDELYWNVIPHGWNVPVEHVSVLLKSPGRIIETSCFEGEYGTEGVCSAYFARADTFQAETLELPPYNGMTIAVALNKGVVTLPSDYTKAWWWIVANFMVLIPFFVFIYMYRMWSDKGRDAKGRGTLVPQYEPPLALTPIFVGSIVDGAANSNDITADIIFLAEQEFLTITRIEERRFLGNSVDYRIEWIGDMDDLMPKEKLVVELLFNVHVQKGDQVLLSELQKDRGIAHRRKKLTQLIDVQLQEQGYYANRPQQTKEKWLAGSAVFGVILIVLWQINMLLGISLAVSLVIVVVFGLLMPKRTLKGAEIRDHILGFKDFLSMTEKDRLDFHNAPERGPTEYMVNLPYAIALGVEEKWAEQFASIHLPQPRWLHGANIEHLNSQTLTSELSTFNSSMNAGVTAAAGGSGTGGGGFSGGGMGGGAGGSW